MLRPVSKKLVFLLWCFAAVGSWSVSGFVLGLLIDDYSHANLKQNYSQKRNDSNKWQDNENLNRKAFDGIFSTQYYCPKSYSKTKCEQWHSEQNLKVQWEAVKRSEEANIISYIAIAITFIGLLAVIWTLYETRRAVDSANEGVKSANDMNEIARNASEIELRAYLSCPIIYLDVLFIINMAKGDISEFGELTIRNHGVTPAYNLEFTLSVSFPHEENDFPTINIAQAAQYIPQNGNTALILDILEEKSLHPALDRITSDHEIIIYCKILYDDEFTKNRSDDKRMFKADFFGKVEDLDWVGMQNVVTR